jgi:acyl-CoA thioester hydrolase
MSEPRPPLAEHTFGFRVRYPETDPIGVVHHSRFLQYFEMGRIELLRSLGHSYADLEAKGVFFVVTRVEVKYRAPARFDEQLQLTTRLVKTTHVRFDHAYELRRDGVLLAEGATTIACVGRDGQVIAIPEEILPPRSP